MQQRRNQNSRQTDPLPGTNAKALQLQTPPQQRDEPEEADETQRQFCRQQEVRARPRGMGEGRIRRMNLHPGTEYQPVPHDIRSRRSHLPIIGARVRVIVVGAVPAAWLAAQPRRPLGALCGAPSSAYNVLRSGTAQVVAWRGTA